MSSISSDSPWRGCASSFPQPVSEEDQRAAQFLVETVYYFNCRGNAPIEHPIVAEDIKYRSSSGEFDILHRVFRWDTTSCQQVFQNGFQARCQEGTSDADYFNLDRYVHAGGRTLDSNPPTTCAFISTTLNNCWSPPIDSQETSLEVYRYEIYAPGGIWVAETLGVHYDYESQDEVCFVAGIAPQYVRSAQLFRLVRDGRDTRMERVETTLYYNENFNPQSHPPRSLRIVRPVLDFYDADRHRVPLTIWNYRPEREKRVVSDDAIDWYSRDVADAETYVTAAFRSSLKNEAYLFMGNEYVRVKYAPGVWGHDKLLYGPALICDGFLSLAGTAFGEYGIDCAFGSHHGNEAFIFSGNLCAQIDYAPGSSDDKILRGPMTIAKMFPFFKGTVFESGVDAAFESSTIDEAYMFKGGQYARINYRDARMISTNPTFNCLKNTIFESGIDAAFALHSPSDDCAYLLKGNSWARINFAADSINNNGVRQILPDDWCSLKSVLPRKNRGLDVHGET